MSRKINPSAVFILIFCLFFAVMIFIDPKSINKSVADGIKTCVYNVIPSLFPFAVIANILISCGAGEAAGVTFHGAMHKLFGISGAGSCSLLLGSVCGFPIGAVTAFSMYDKGILSKREVEHLLTFSNNPSSAFIIGTVGVAMLQSRSAGILLYCVSLGSAAVIGIFGRFILKPDAGRGVSASNTYPCRSGAGIFTDAVSSATKSITAVCSYVIFFSAFSGAVKSLLEEFSTSQVTFALITGGLEMTGGVTLASRLSGRILPIVTCALICGWSGFSVHLQIMSLRGNRDISMKPYFTAKIAQALLCASAVAVILLLFPDFLSEIGRFDIPTYSISLTMPYYFALPTDILFFASLPLTVFTGVAKKKIKGSSQKRVP